MSDFVEERRQEPRIKKLNLVQVSRFNEEGFRADLATGRTLDISHGGIRLELNHPLPLRSVVGLTLAIVGEIVEVSGTVVYLEVLDDEICVMGIQFANLGEKAKRVIDACVVEAKAS